MRLRRAVIAACVFVVLLAGLAGCATSLAAVRTQHAASFECDRKDVSVRILGKGHIEASGCSHTMRYRCAHGECLAEAPEDSPSQPKPVIDDTPYRLRAHRAVVAFYRTAVRPTCSADDAEAPELHPGEYPVELQDPDGHAETVSRPCGLVLAEISDQSFLSEFVSHVCGGNVDARCNQAYEAMFEARLRERYPRAAIAALNNKCTAHPIDCQEWVNRELWWLESHNDRVLEQQQQVIAQAHRDADRAGSQARAELAARQREEQAAAELREAEVRERRRRRARAVSEAFKAAGDGFRAAGAVQPRQTSVSCTSTAIGSTTYTSCQ